ncbi:MAG: hypothetical protein WEB93_00345, partial [Sphingomonadales bacterium]
MFGLGGTGQNTGFQVVQFDTNLLGAYYEARSLSAATGGASRATPPASDARGPAVETPWDRGEDDRSLERRVNEVRNTTQFVDERSPEAQMAGDDKDSKALFTLYRALTKLQAIAEYGARSATTDATREPLDALLQRGLREIQDYTATASLDKLDLIYGSKSNRVESAITVGRNETKVTGAAIRSAARTDPIPGLNGDEIFTVSITRSNETHDIQVDLSEMPGPVTLDALTAHVNDRIRSIQATDDLGDPVVDDGGNPVPLFSTRMNVETVEGGFALAFSGMIAEQVSLSAAVAEPSLFLAGSNRAVGSDAVGSATLTRLDGVTTEDPNRALRRHYAGTSTPILEAREEEEEDGSGRTNEVIDNIRNQVSELFDQLEITNDDDDLTRPPAETQGAAVAVDSQGHVFTVGATAGDIDNQVNRSDGSDVYLSKYDASGTLVWQRLLGASGTAEGLDIAIDSQDNVVVVGAVDGTLTGKELYAGQDSFAVKFDNSGDRLWTQQLDSMAQDAAASVTIDANDDIYINGYTTGVFTGGMTHGGARDAYVARLSGTNGALDAAAQHGGGGNEAGRAIAMASDGNVLMVTEEDGRAVLRKLDHSDLSNTLWTVDIGELQTGAVTGIAVEGNSIYIAGHTGNAGFGDAPINTHEGGQDGFVSRIDDAGASASAAWTSYVGTGSSDYIEDITVSGGQVYVGGRTAGAFDGADKSGATDAFAARISGDDGSRVWTEQIGGAGGFNGASGLAFASRGSSVLTALGLGPGEIQSSQDRDVM